MQTGQWLCCKNIPGRRDLRFQIYAIPREGWLALLMLPLLMAEGPQLEDSAFFA
jgi:hypothetical protein